MRRIAWHSHALHRLVLGCLRPQALAFVPALALAGYWYGLAGLAALLAVLTPLILLTGGIAGRSPSGVGVDALTGLASREGFIQHLDTLLAEAEDQGSSVIVLAIGLDEAEALRSRFGTTGLETALLRIADRVDGSVRRTDASARLDGDRFALALSQPRSATVDVAVAASSRVQAAIAEPISLTNTQAHSPRSR